MDSNYILASGFPLCPRCKQCGISEGMDCPVCLARTLNAKPPLGAPLVERELRCCTCQRLYARVLARANATIVTLCEGCEREGR
jgi:hypothetical protein